MQYYPKWIGCLWQDPLLHSTLRPCVCCQAKTLATWRTSEQRSEQRASAVTMRHFKSESEGSGEVNNCSKSCPWKLHPAGLRNIPAKPTCSRLEAWELWHGRQRRPIWVKCVSLTLKPTFSKTSSWSPALWAALRSLSCSALVQTGKIWSSSLGQLSIHFISYSWF